MIKIEVIVDNETKLFNTEKEALKFLTSLHPINKKEFHNICVSYVFELDDLSDYKK